MKKLVFVFALTALFSCYKEKGSSCSCGGLHTDSILTVQGKIIWSGPLETDGYGWELKVNNEAHTFYLLKDLPADFQHDSLAVQACIYKTNDKTCSWGGCFNRYGVSSIRKS
jgi:hypothetical protein